MPGKYVKKKKFPWIPVLILVFLAVAALVLVLFLGGRDTQEPTEPIQTSAPTVPETTVPSSSITHCRNELE